MKGLKGLKGNGGKIQRIAGICAGLAGVALICSGLRPGVSEAFTGIGFPVMIFGIFLTVYSFDWKGVSGKDGGCDGRGRENIFAFGSAAFFRWRGLESFCGDILRVYFDESGFIRLIVYRRADGCVSFRKERLCAVDGAEYSEKAARTDYCWIPTDDDTFLHLYDGEESALNDLRAELAPYTEAEIPTDLSRAQTAKKRGGSVSVWGNWLGGRPYDNIFFLCYFSLTDGKERLILHFSGGERCTVLNPEGITDTDGEFSVKSASAVIWEFYHYGKSQSEETKTIVCYERRDGGIFMTATGYDRVQEGNFPPKGEAFCFL